MPSITKRTLSITLDESRKTAHVVVEAQFNFRSIERCILENCDATLALVRCFLMASDVGEQRPWGDPVGHLYTMPGVLALPESSSPPVSVPIRWEDTLGEGVLDEDPGLFGWWWASDEIYAQIVLTNYLSGLTTSSNTNTVQLTIPT